MKKVGFFSVVLVVCAVLNGLVPGISRAQEPYPSRPVQIIVPFPPGGVSDLIARPFAFSLEKALKQPVAIVNKTGASGIVGMQTVAVAKPDGYTLLVALSTISVTPEVDALLSRPPTYKLEDFAPLALLSSDPPVLVVRKNAPWMTLRDFIADAKQRPNQIKYSTGGIYAIMHLATELFTNAAGIKLVHIPTAGGGPAMNALLGGHVDCSMPGPNVVYPQIKAGSLRALVCTGSKRLAAIPDVPTLKELGYDVDYFIWTGFFAPKGISSSVMKVLRGATRQAVNSAEFKAAMENMQAPITYLAADEFQKFWDKDAKRLNEIVRRIGKIQ
jgi:tripartite-type tricarboxylate transporter receptor subunit TctC